MPVLTAGKYKLTMGPISFTVGPKWSGRINSIQYAGNEVLNQDSSITYPTDPTNFGSTFWPTPQAYWTKSCRSTTNISCFPPDTMLDGKTDSARITSDTAVAFSTPAADSNTLLRFGKKYWANLSDSSINLQYTMYDTSLSKPDTFGAWEDTRIPAGGLYLFPYGPDTTTGALASLTQDSLGVTWMQYDSATIPTTGTNKFYRSAGSQGWYAHIDKNGVLFIKEFTPYPVSEKPPAATKEKQIELYAQNQGTTKTTSGLLVEMELQGPYLPIAPGDSMGWNEKWYVRRVPSSMSITVGNPALIALISQITGTTPPLGISPLSPAPAGFSSLDYSGGQVTVALKAASNISLALVNSQGQTIQRIYSGSLTSGPHAFTVEPGVPRGIYWLLLKSSGTRALTSKMIVRF